MQKPKSGMKKPLCKEMLPHITTSGFFTQKDKAYRKILNKRGSCLK